MNVIPQSLIICSNPIDGTTMKDADVQNYLFPKLFPHGHNPIFLSGMPGERFPENIPEHVKFDVILFAGCNVLQWLFEDPNIINKLPTFLTSTGMILFIESYKYINRLSGNTIHKPTIRIETMKSSSSVRESYEDVLFKETVVKLWNKTFSLVDTGEFYVYITKTIGGKSKHKRTRKYHSRRTKGAIRK